MQTFRKFLLSFLAFFVLMNPAFAVFSDVKDELKPSVIEFLRENKIGDTNDNFYPRRPVSLSEFISMGLIAAGVDEDVLEKNRASRFADVDPDAWYQPFINEADRLGILDEFRGSRLLPHRTLTKGEAIKLALEIFGVGVPPVPVDEEFGFKDVRPSHRLSRYVFRALKMGIVEAESDDLFGITERINRAETATLFYNLANWGGDQTINITIQNGFSSIPNSQLFETVWDQVKKDFLFVDRIDEEKMLYEALRGAVNSLEDPHSEFLPPEKTRTTTQSLSGEVEGIGAYLLQNDDGDVIIVSPIKNSPADKAGLKPLDKILAVDGKAVGGMSVEEVANLVRGTAGSNVKLTILRGENTLEFSIVRAKVEIKSVNLEFRNNIAVVSLTQFGGATPDEFAEVAKEIVNKKPHGILIDLRNNGGGLVTTAIDLMGYFLPKDSVIATAKFREDLSNLNIDYKTEREDPILARFPLVVLVNKGSASASEIMTAALKDYGKAKIVGETTFGKGTVQEVSFFSDGTALKLTVANWLTPKGNLIDGVGISPDIESVDDEKTSQDEALEKALHSF